MRRWYGARVHQTGDVYRQRTGLSMVRKGKRKKLMSCLGEGFTTRRPEDGEKTRENTARGGLHKGMVNSGEHTEALYR